jgi:protein-tyrosine kinase
MNLQENVLPIESSRVIGRQDRSLGAILIEEGKLNSVDIERILELQRMEGLRFGEAALRLGLITAQDLSAALAKQYDVPHVTADGDASNKELIAAYQPFHRRVEELRALRTQLLIRWYNPDANRKVLAVVSPGPGEGRTYVAANLALVFAQLGERTLLIDADMRAPRQHRLFNVPDRMGLSAALSGRADRSAVVACPDYGRLWVLPAGALPPNPQELLARHALGLLLKELQSDFDIVLIDTPPAKLYADAQAVAFRAGNAMVLARKDETRLADTTTLVREFGDTGTHVVGTVINDF